MKRAKDAVNYSTEFISRRGAGEDIACVIHASSEFAYSVREKIENRLAIARTFVPFSLRPDNSSRLVVAGSDGS